MRLIERLAKIAAAVALLFTVLPLGARLGWALELTTHFRLQYLAAQLLLIALLAMRRRFVWCAALAAGAALNAVPLLPYVAIAPDAGSARAPQAVTVLAANLYYRNTSAARLLEIVRAATPDLLVLAEVTPAWAKRLAELRTAYPYRLEQPRDDPYGIAVYSRYDFASVTPIALGTVTAIEARVRSPGGAFTLIGVHLRSPTRPERAAERNRELDLLAARVAALDGPVIVAGDFNSTPYSPYFADWLAATGLTDTRRGRTLSPSWPAFLPILGIPIDHCAVSDDFRILEHRRLPAFGSDHYPILVRLALEPAVPP